MTEEHRKLLTAKGREIGDSMNPENGLVDELFRRGVFSMYDTKRLEGKNRPMHDMSRDVLGIVMRKSDSAFNNFILPLNSTGPEHVVEILTGQGESPLSSLRCKVLTKARKSFIQKVDRKSSSLVDELISNGVLSVVDKERIEAAQQTDECKARVLIDIIAGKSQVAYDKFLWALKDSGHRPVAEMLERLEVEVQGFVDKNFRSGTLSEQKTTIKLVSNMEEVLVSGRKQTVNQIASLWSRTDLQCPAYVKCFQLQGRSLPDRLTRGFAPGPHWGLGSQTSVIGSRWTRSP